MKLVIQIRPTTSIGGCGTYYRPDRTQPPAAGKDYQRRSAIADADPIKGSNPSEAYGRGDLQFVAGNTFDKYRSGNVIHQRLMAQFMTSLIDGVIDVLVDARAPA